MYDPNNVQDILNAKLNDALSKSRVHVNKSLRPKLCYNK